MIHVCIYLYRLYRFQMSYRHVRSHEVASRMLLEKNTGGSLPLDGEDQRARDSRDSQRFSVLFCKYI